MVDSVCSREPRRRYRGTTRPAKVSPRRNPGSAFGRGLQAWGVVAQSCADLGRSDRQIGGDLVIPLLQRGARDQFSWSEISAVKADWCSGQGALMMLDSGAKWVSGQ
jgi:hypothetical protein